MKTLNSNILTVNKFLIIVIVFLITIGCKEKTSYKFLVDEHENDIDTLQIKQVNVFVETSASMKGYVNSNASGNYPLKDVIPFLVTDIDNTFQLKSNLFTISDKERRFNYSKNSFFNQLAKGQLFTGKSSKLHHVFTSVIATAKEETISILITDGIPDLGTLNTDSQGSKIESHIYESLVVNKELGVALFKYHSDFNGTHYFNKRNNDGVYYKKRPFYNIQLKNRPLYVWVFGNKSLVSKLLSKPIFKAYKEAHSYNLPLAINKSGLLKYPKSGKIAINEKKNTVTIQEIGPKKPARFVIGLDLNKQPDVIIKGIQDGEYNITPKYLEELIKVKVLNKGQLYSYKIKDKSIIENSGFTHFVQLTIKDFDLMTQEIKISKSNATPLWLKTTSINNDIKISTQDLEHKTYGFNYIINAFDRAYNNDSPQLQWTFTKQLTH